MSNPAFDMCTAHHLPTAVVSVLLISVPPMAASFFNATIGQFYTYSGVNGGGANHPGPQGQPPGSYGGRGGGQSAEANPVPLADSPVARAGGLKAAANKDEKKSAPSQQGWS